MLTAKHPAAISLLNRSMRVCSCFSVAILEDLGRRSALQKVCSYLRSATGLTEQPMAQADAWRKIRRRAASAGLGQPVMHWPDLQVDGLDAAERPFHQSEGFVASHRGVIIENQEKRTALTMSAATIDRALRDVRDGAGVQRRRNAPPSAAIRRSIWVRNLR
jgi:hypothetical protein